MRSCSCNLKRRICGSGYCTGKHDCSLSNSRSKLGGYGYCTGQHTQKHDDFHHESLHTEHDQRKHDQLGGRTHHLLFYGAAAARFCTCRRSFPAASSQGKTSRAPLKLLPTATRRIYFADFLRLAQSAAAASSESARVAFFFLVIFLSSSFLVIGRQREDLIVVDPLHDVSQLRLRHSERLCLLRLGGLTVDAMLSLQVASCHCPEHLRQLLPLSRLHHAAHSDLKTRPMFGSFCPTWCMLHAAVVAVAAVPAAVASMARLSRKAGTGHRIE